MSNRLTREDTLWHQRLWASEELYTGELDGLWGPKTEEASQAFDYHTRKLRKLHGEFDSRTERNIVSMSLSAQTYARASHRRLMKAGVECKVISGRRTYAHQAQLYSIGRTTELDRRVVTYARAGRSMHNFGIAWDYGAFPNGQYDGDTVSLYQRIGEVLRPYWESDNAPMRWGGQWSNPDWPHFQLALRQRATIVAQYFEQGQVFAALNHVA